MNDRAQKLSGLAGILYPVLQLASQALFQSEGMEPVFTAPADEIQAYFSSRNALFADIGGYLSVLSVIFFVVFAAGLWQQLKPSGDFLPATMLGFGLVSASILMMSGGWALALFRIDQGLDPQLGRMLFDEGNLNFANLWVMLGGMVLAAGLAFPQLKNFPRWLSGASIILGFGLIGARAIWTSQAAFAPYVFFWVWMIYLGIHIYRRNSHA